MEAFETELKNKNGGYLRLILWQKAMPLFELTHRVAFADPRIDFKLRAQFADAAAVYLGKCCRRLRATFNRLHYEVENRLLRLVERWEEKRDRGDWTSRIAETDEGDADLLISQDSLTPVMQHSGRVHA